MHVGSSHNSLDISDNIRSYLNCEWQRKLDEQDCTSTAMRWLKEHPGMPHSFDTDNMPSRVPGVPFQNNDYDCGLFMLAFMDFWTATPPDQIVLDDTCRWTGKHSTALRHSFDSCYAEAFELQHKLTHRCMQCMWRMGVHVLSVLLVAVAIIWASKNLLSSVPEFRRHNAMVSLDL